MSEFNINDEVFCIHYGVGKIIDIVPETEEVSYPILVDFESKKKEKYTRSGKKYHSDAAPSLLHMQEAAQIFPQYCKQKKTTYINMYFYGNNSRLYSVYAYKTEAEAQQAADTSWEGKKIIAAPFTVEV